MLNVSKAELNLSETFKKCVYVFKRNAWKKDFIVSNNQHEMSQTGPNQQISVFSKINNKTKTKKMHC